MTQAIHVRGLRKGYGSTVVLDDLDLDVRRGEIFALLGPNGAGKTTTLSILTTLVRPDAGDVRVAGFDVRTDAEEVRRRISLTGQSAAVDDVLTASENLVMLGRLSGLSARRARSRADDLLERFALTDAASRRVGTFSGGMRRRLDLALSFVTVPEVLFLDEPTTGLDARSRLDLWDVIRTLSDAGTTVLLTTQYLEEADRLADRVGVLDGGATVAVGTPAELKARVGADVIQLHDSSGALLRELPSDGRIRTVADQLATLGRETALDGATVSIRRPSLDDVFLALTGHATADRATAKESA